MHQNSLNFIWLCLNLYSIFYTSSEPSFPFIVQQCSFSKLCVLYLKIILDISNYYCLRSTRMSSNITRFTWSFLSFTSHCIINFDSQYVFKMKSKVLYLLHRAIFHIKIFKIRMWFSVTANILWHYNANVNSS